MKISVKKTGAVGALVAAACMTVVVTQTPAAAQSMTSGVTNWQTGYCLDSDAGGAVYTKGNSNGCGANNPYQRWFFHSSGKGLMLQNSQTGLCLTGGGTGSDRVTARACDSENPRQWWEQHYVMADVSALINHQNKRALDSNMKGNAYTSTFSESNSYMKWHIPFA
ncbi:ricin-type beta-trefoil lectin domain protein [Streptomyces sp. NPDC007904]|uniref:RICIN domain-containing protein n=1 Tax=Streptomyces sp. NPDC007904 TaxID=3364787 RepID=UPI0036E57197